MVGKRRIQEPTSSGPFLRDTSNTLYNNGHYLYVYLIYSKQLTMTTVCVFVTPLSRHLRNWFVCYLSAELLKTDGKQKHCRKISNNRCALRTIRTIRAQSDIITLVQRPPFFS
jgi:pyrroloquinoline quinone (PQQ) biosynthesis protein C